MKIDLTESFPHLPKAPIVEAVIDVRTRAELPWEESAILAKLKSQLPDYPKVSSQKEFQHEIKVGPEQPPEQSFQDLGWKGLRFQTDDDLHIAQFNRDGFVFSRLQPYLSWNAFVGEALRLWQLHMELAQPTEVHRLGLRFINRILIPEAGVQLENYLHASPQTPRDLDLPFMGFFHRDMLDIPGYPYAMNIIRTVQPPQGTASEGVGLILDTDVYTTEPFELQSGVLEQRLAEMRWLKNKVFFGSLTNQALERFQ